MPSLKCKIFFGLTLEDPENFPSSGIWYELKLLLLSPCISDKNKLYLSLQSWLQKLHFNLPNTWLFKRRIFLAEAILGSLNTTKNAATVNKQDTRIIFFFWEEKNVGLFSGNDRNVSICFGKQWKSRVGKSTRPNSPEKYLF